MVGRAKGYPVELVMPESVSEERKRLCRAYGARIVLTDAFSGSDGAMVRVREIVAARSRASYFYADQYRNPANPLAHYRTTGPEIWEQTGGRITHFVAGLGTTGTVVGTGRYLHERNPRVRVVAVEPDEPLHGLEGLKHLASARRTRDLRPAGCRTSRSRCRPKTGYACARPSSPRTASSSAIPRGRRSGRRADRWPPGSSGAWWWPSCPTAASGT